MNPAANAIASYVGVTVNGRWPLRQHRAGWERIGTSIDGSSGRALREQPRPCPTLCRRVEMAERTCSVDGCGKRAVARGWCNSHYQKEWRKADWQYAQKRTFAAERFWAKVDSDGPIPGCAPELGACWLSAKKIRGYGAFSIDGNAGYLAHRWAYENTIGPIPDGLVLDHLCRVPACVRPSHLEPVTSAENTARGEKAMRTKCRRGHAYDKKNTYITPRGIRKCRRCRADDMAKAKARAKARLL